MAGRAGRLDSPSRAATLADVARVAKASKAAAARALGGYGSVSADLRQRVQEAARQLDYRPNELARTMATGRSRTLGLIVGDIENPFFGLAVRGVSDEARRAGLQVILCNSGEDVAEERAAARMLLAQGVDGLIVAPAAMREHAHLHDAIARGCPLVLLDREVPGLQADAALVDGRQAAHRATQCLIAAGHRRIAYLTATRAAQARYGGPEQIMLTTVRDRIAGFLEAARQAGLPEPEGGIRLGATDASSAQAIVAELLIGQDRPTAILARTAKWRSVCSAQPRRWA